LHQASPAESVDRLADMPIDQLAVVGAAPLVSSDTATARRRDPLPLFIDAFDDQPLVKVPAVPRPPLSVRRAPDTPRVPPAALSRRRTTVDDESQLVLGDEPSPAELMRGRPRSASRVVQADAVEACTPGARLGAAMLDLGMLFAVDLVILYLTLRMAALSFGDWRVLPLAPLIGFLLIIKLAYYWAFTAIGGQTIGKMAMRIRVIADQGIDVDPSVALRRTVLAATSVVTLGAAFLPALVRSDRRAMHDHLAHTRVIALPAA
jgi:uncharacterized RDD family membrane protein YckC